MPRLPEKAASAPATSGLAICLLHLGHSRAVPRKLTKAHLWTQTLHLRPSLNPPHPQDRSGPLSLHLPLE